MDNTRHGRSREDLSVTSGRHSITIRAQILYGVIPNIFFIRTLTVTSGLTRTAAAVPIDVMGEIVRMNPDGAPKVAGQELTPGDQAPDGSGREPEDRGDLIDQVELG